jgi:hypothetical protein
VVKNTYVQGTCIYIVHVGSIHVHTYYV